jgi:hypothetical protein
LHVLPHDEVLGPEPANFDGHLMADFDEPGIRAGTARSEHCEEMSTFDEAGGDAIAPSGFSPRATYAVIWHVHSRRSVVGSVEYCTDRQGHGALLRQCSNSSWRSPRVRSSTQRKCEHAGFAGRNPSDG